MQRKGCGNKQPYMFKHHPEYRALFVEGSWKAVIQSYWQSLSHQPLLLKKITFYFTTRYMFQICLRAFVRLMYQEYRRVKLFEHTALIITFNTPVCGPRYLNQYSDSLRAGQSGDRILVGARFSAPVQISPGAHPGDTVGKGSFPGGKAVGAWRLPPTPSSAEVKERVELYLYSTSEPSWPLTGWTLPLPLPLPLPLRRRSIRWTLCDIWP